jgi:hypothetical protein
MLDFGARNGRRLTCFGQTVHNDHRWIVASPIPVATMTVAVGTGACERGLAERAEAGAVSCKARLRPFDVGHGVAAESECVVRTGLAGGFSPGRTEISRRRSSHHAESDHRHKTNRAGPDILHHAQSSCRAHSLTASPRTGKVGKKTYYSLKTGCLLVCREGRPYPTRSSAKGSVRTARIGLRRSCRLASIGVICRPYRLSPAA